MLQRIGATCNQAHHHSFRYAECRWAFRGIKNAKTSARSSAQINQPTATPKGVNNSVDRLRDLRQDFLDSGGYQMILGENAAHDSKRRQQIDMHSERLSLFSNQLIQFR